MKKSRFFKASLALSLVVFILFLAQSFFIPFVREKVEVDELEMPTDPYALGEYYFNFGNKSDAEYSLTKAREYFEEALRTEPGKNEGVWYQLGRIDFLEGDFDAALYKFQKQLDEFGIAYPNVYYMIGLTNGYKARESKDVSDWAAAEMGFIKYLELDSSSPWARTDLAWLYFAQDKFAEMGPVLELGLLLNPEHPWLMNMYGLYLLNTNRQLDSKYYFDKALESAESLTHQDWGKAYPGNNPLFWKDGLSEFKSVIEYNRNLVKE